MRSNVRAFCLICGADETTAVDSVWVSVDLAADEAFLLWTCRHCGTSNERAISWATADSLLLIGCRLAAVG